MKILYVDCGMGAAGDMLMGSLVSLLPSGEQKEFINKLNNIGIPGVTVTLEDDEKCGIKGKHVKVIIRGNEEESLDVHAHEGHPHGQEGHVHEEHTHGHDHEIHSHEEHIHGQEGHIHEHSHGEHSHNHGHHHASMADIEHMISHLSVSNQVKLDVRAVYKMIAEAESKVHGKDVSEIHFHEVGMVDALCDITGCAMLLEKLAPDQIIVSPVNVGFGKVRCAHGILPVPAPATADLLAGVPCYAGRIEGEMCTPTGAALLKYYADRFGNMPPMAIQSVGYGTGKKDFEAANVVRTILGEDVLSISEMPNNEPVSGGTSTGGSSANELSFKEASTNGTSTNEVVELACNIDDMTAEELGFAMDVLLENGALDVFTTAIGMKKSRPGILLSVICKEGERDNLAALIFKHTTTIGIREKRCRRMVLDRRESVFHSSIGDVRIKESSGYGVVKRKIEYEDLKKLAENNGISIGEARRIIEKENSAEKNSKQ